MAIHRDAKIEALRNVPLFSKLPKAGLRRVASLADEIDLPAGRKLTREGDRGQEFFVLLEGGAEVRRNGRKLNTLGKGDFLGEIALVSKAPRTATVTTTEPTRALVITGRGFSALLKEQPQIAAGVLEALGDRLAPGRL